MVLLQKIKAMLGLGESESEREADREVGVTVERGGATDDAAETPETGTTEPEPAGSEPDEPDPLDEPDETVLGEESMEIDDEPATEPDADADDSDATDDSTEPAGEPDEAAAAGGSAASSTGSITEPADSPEEATEPAEAVGPGEDDAVPESEADAGTTGEEPVDTIKGIGSAYAERLEGAGVETVGDLATADSEDLAGETGIAPTRVQGWIDRAKSR